ncbi:MAG: dihydroxy-acid dehydratase, partial [Bacilli bacterium]
GGCLGLVVDGDTIVIDLDQRLIQLEVSEEELLKRQEDFKANVRLNHDYLDVYTSLASNASKGGAFKYD